MTDQPRSDRTPDEVLSDPRISSEQLRLFRGPDETPLLVVGCVHDHPASVYRVRALVEALVPDVVAVELPGLALPLFERVGRSGGSEPYSGGETSVALAAGAAVGARRRGVDTLDARFVRSLAGELRRESASLSTIRRALRAVLSVTKHALICRASAALGRYGTPSPVLKRAYDHDLDRTATPTEQAADERRRLARSLSVLRAFERPVVDAVIDRARERTMAANLVTLLPEGTVLAVVGFDHLAGITERLFERGATRLEPGVETIMRVWNDPGEHHR